MEKFHRAVVGVGKLSPRTPILGLPAVGLLRSRFTKPYNLSTSRAGEEGAGWGTGFHSAALILESHGQPWVWRSSRLPLFLLAGPYNILQPWQWSQCLVTEPSCSGELGLNVLCCYLIELLRWWKQSISALSHTVATSHLERPSIWTVAGEALKLNYNEVN